MKKTSLIFSLILSITLWCITLFYFNSQRADLKPEALVERLQEHINSQQKAVRSLMANKELMTHIWQNKLSEAEFNFLSKQKFIINLYENGRLTFWNNNDIVISEFRNLPRLTTLIEGKNVSLYQSFGKEAFPQKRINIIIPVYKFYEINNEYIQSGFVGAPNIPESSEITFSKTKDAQLIRSVDKVPLFFVSVKMEDIKPICPDLISIFLTLSSLISIILTVQLLGAYFSKKISPIAGIIFVFFIVASIRLFIYCFGLPFGLQNLEIFSPQVFASDNFLPSFGHLFFHVLCIYWLFSFITSKSSGFENINFEIKNVKLSRFVFFITAFSLFIFLFYQQYLIKSIVFDSDISFDTNTFNATDKFTLLSLIIIAIIARILLLTLRISNSIFEKSSVSTIFKYPLLLAILCSLSILIKIFYTQPNTLFSFQSKDWMVFLGIFWFVFYLFLIDNRHFKKWFPKTGMFTLIFISVYFSIFFSIIFKLYIDEKEHQINRISFAQKLSRHQDTELELKFESIESKIIKDTVLQNWLIQADSIKIENLYKHFKIFNPDIFFGRYAQDIFLYNSNKISILQQEKTLMDSLLLIKKESIPTVSSSLFFRIENSEEGAYLVYLPILKEKTNKILGYLFINFRLRQNISQSVYPHLLQSNSEIITKRDLKYNYAIYINNKLANQFGNYDFDYVIAPLLFNQQFLYTRKNNYSELYYKSEPNRLYVVVYKNNVFVGIITIFSFLFGIFLLISSFENWISILISSWASGKKIRMFYNASMSVRVKYFALGFTAISFLIIGISTVYFLTDRYQLNSMKTIEQNDANVSEALTEFIQNQYSIVSQKSILNEQVGNTDFAYFLKNIAQQQKIDINVFDIEGKLAFTTQENIYKDNFLDNKMSANAFYMLKQKKRAHYVQPEEIGALKYTASYSNILNNENKLIGYLNIPSFYTKQNLDNQIISLITTLVNIYTILLLISSIITFLFISSLTKSLRIVTESFRNVNLKKNELIIWPYNDEIGLLVNEYNKMVGTVEKNARSLVLDERQNAWREMAQQVAHEIKNPLTPMKLNIQYLQQAINSNHPDIINLTKRVSSSIIEQIDNLNYIASEFSNFAKMPESKSERIDLKNMLEIIISLFSGNSNLKLTYSYPEMPAIVFADKSQMLRIFTNIVQNAVESFSDEKQGIVDIQLLYGAQDDKVIIKVSDNGDGIPEDVQDRIFEPYFTTKSSGTGLGLAMTKKIIELWGGSIRFESTKEEGTTFFLSVPVG